MNFDNTYVSIDLDVISANFDRIAAKAGTRVMAVIKADAYGHGAVQVGRLLKDKCSFFGVSSMLEALELRQAGLDTPILILGQTPVAAFPDAVRLGIRPAIFHYEAAQALSAEAVRQGVQAPFHFAVDTGMSRLGMQATEESADLCAKIAKLPGLYAEGLFSHFATADCADLTRARAQAAKFDAFDAMLKERGLNIPIRHMDNSAGLLNFDNHYEMVRSGIITYGLYPSDEVIKENLDLKPAMEWKTHIVNLKEIEPGEGVSYGHTFVAKDRRTIATLTVGYADGYPRSLSGKGRVLIRGQYAPIVGRVCMDQMMVDVTEIKDASLLDEVTLMGRDGENEITADELAGLTNTINYELVCGISRRVPHVIYEDGKITEVIDYLTDTLTVMNR